MNILALLSLGLLTGNEFSVGAFVNPSLARLAERERAAGAQAMARTLGRVIPFWMAATLVLLGWVALRTDTSRAQWGASAALMATVIVWTIIFPVPINNRISRWNLDQLPANWRDELARFALFHNIRVALLLLSTLIALRAAVA